MGFFLILILATFFISRTWSLTTNTYEIRDLETTSSSNFQAEAAYWQAYNTGSTTTKATQCWNTWILQGYTLTKVNGYYTRTYASLPPHNLIRFSMKVYAIDLEPNDDMLSIYFDTILIKTLDSDWYTPGSFSGYNLCGNNGKEYFGAYFGGLIAHNSSALTLKVLSKRRSGDSFSYGIRDLSLLFQVDPSPTTSVCSWVYPSSSGARSCFCLDGTYNPTGSSSCSGSCSSACKTCNGPASTDCTSCKSGYSYNGQSCVQCGSLCSQCDATNCIQCNSGTFLYWNGTCKSTCSSPLVTGSSSCSLPCPIGEFYYQQNGTCQTSCTGNFIQAIQGDLKICNFACPNSYYLYSNGSCMSSCPSPFTSVVKGVERYCNSPCPAGEYWFVNNSSCGATCDSPCYQVNQGIITYCLFQCSSPDYLFRNLSCLSSCTSPFSVATDATNQYCNSPCPIGEYWFESNSSCESSCNPPYSQVAEGSIVYCRFHCLASEYYYANSSCSSSCPSPFIVTTQGTIKFCDSPCPSGKFWFESNSSCETDCKSPYIQITEGMLTYCRFPCLSAEYMYLNGSCLSCPTSFRYSKGGNKYCSFYCEDGSYLYWNKTCGSSCSTPLVKSSDSEFYNFCNLPCDSSEYLNTDTNKCVSSCDSTKIILENGMLQLCKPAETTLIETVTSVIAGASVAGNIIRSNNLNSAFMISLAKLLKYIQWINVPIPQDVRDTLSPNVTGGISITQMFSYSMPEGLQDKFANHNLPGLFSQSIDHSSYLVNHWNTISSYLFLIALGIAASVFERLIQNTKYPRIILIVKRLRIVTRWNFFLYAFFNTYDDITLFAILEFKTLTFDSAYAFISLIVCMVVSLCAAWLFYRGLAISLKAFRLKFKVSCKTDTEDKYVTFYKKWENYQVFYSGFKDNSLLSQTYLLVFTFRVFLCYIIVGLLYEYPLIQVFQLLLLSIVSLVYVIKYRPILDWFSEIVNLGYEVLILVANATLTLLGLLSSSGHLSASLQYKLGQVILINNMLANILSTIFSWGYLLTGLYSAYQISKKYGFKGKTAWIAGFLSPYSNPGMDFNEISYKNHGEGDTNKVSPVQGLEKSNILRPILMSTFSLKIMGNDSDSDSFAKGVSSQSHQKRSSAFLSLNGNQSDGTCLSNAQNESKLHFIDALSPTNGGWDSRKLGSSSRKALRTNSNLASPPNKDGDQTSIVLEESNYDQRRLNNTNSQQSLKFGHDVFTLPEFGFVSPANNDANRLNNIRRRIKRTINNMTRTEILDQFNQPTETIMEEANQSPFSGGEEESFNPLQELRDDSIISTGKRNPKKRTEIGIINLPKSKESSDVVFLS